MASGFYFIIEFNKAHISLNTVIGTHAPGVMVKISRFNKNAHEVVTAFGVENFVVFNIITLSIRYHAK